MKKRGNGSLKELRKEKSEEGPFGSLTKLEERVPFILVIRNIRKFVREGYFGFWKKLENESEM